MKPYNTKDIIKQLTLSLPTGDCRHNPVRRKAMELLVLLHRNPELVPDQCYTKSEADESI